MRESSYCFQYVLAIAILSLRLSIRLSHGWISQKWSKLGLPNLRRRLSETRVFQAADGEDLVILA